MMSHHHKIEDEYCKEKLVDCFAFGTYGRCIALSDTRFKHGCPFYKPRVMAEIEKQTAVERLEKQNRYDLIKKYSE